MKNESVCRVSVAVLVFTLLLLLLFPVPPFSFPLPPPPPPAHPLFPPIRLPSPILLLIIFIHPTEQRRGKRSCVLSWDRSCPPPLLGAPTATGCSSARSHKAEGAHCNGDWRQCEQGPPAQGGQEIPGSHRQQGGQAAKDDNQKCCRCTSGVSNLGAPRPELFWPSRPSWIDLAMRPWKPNRHGRRRRGEWRQELMRGERRGIEGEWGTREGNERGL